MEIDPFRRLSIYSPPAIIKVKRVEKVYKDKKQREKLVDKSDDDDKICPSTQVDEYARLEHLTNL
jgi:hypothetical protein